MRLEGRKRPPWSEDDDRALLAWSRENAGPDAVDWRAASLFLQRPQAECSHRLTYLLRQRGGPSSIALQTPISRRTKRPSLAPSAPSTAASSPSSVTGSSEHESASDDNNNNSNNNNSDRPVFDWPMTPPGLAARKMESESDSQEDEITDLDEDDSVLKQILG